MNSTIVKHTETNNIYFTDLIAKVLHFVEKSRY